MEPIDNTTTGFNQSELSIKASDLSASMRSHCSLEMKWIIDQQSNCRVQDENKYDSVDGAGDWDHIPAVLMYWFRRLSIKKL